jgi:hypothetical protein
MIYKIETNKGQIEVNYRTRESLETFLNRHYKSWKIIEGGEPENTREFKNAYNTNKKIIEQQLLRFRTEKDLILTFRCTHASNINYYINKHFEDHESFGVYKTNVKGEFIVFKKVEYKKSDLYKNLEKLPQANSVSEVVSLVQNNISLVYNGTSITAIRKKIKDRLNFCKIKNRQYLVTKITENRASKELYHLQTQLT